MRGKARDAGEGHDRAAVMAQLRGAVSTKGQFYVRASDGADKGADNSDKGGKKDNPSDTNLPANSPGGQLPADGTLGSSGFGGMDGPDELVFFFQPDDPRYPTLEIVLGPEGVREMTEVKLSDKGITSRTALSPFDPYGDDPYEDATPDRSQRGFNNGYGGGRGGSPHKGSKGKLKKEALAELDGMIGLGTVKDAMSEIAAELRAQKAKESLEVKPKLGKDDVPGMHFMFSGNPGTGKTTVARILGKYLYSIGALEKGHVVEVDRTKLLSDHIGSGDKMTAEKIREAMGGILLVDEAYSLVKKGDKGGKDFGNDVINAINKAMEDHRDELCVIFTGYEEPMNEFLKGNEGLKSRITHFIDFPDYTVPELDKIFDLRMSKENLDLSAGAREAVTTFLGEEKASHKESFGNSRLVRNLVNKIVKAQSLRLEKEGTLDAVEQLEIALLEAQQKIDEARDRGEDVPEDAPEIPGGNGAAPTPGPSVIMDRIEQLKAALTSVTAADIKVAAEKLRAGPDAKKPGGSDERYPMGFIISKDMADRAERWEKRNAGKGPQPAAPTP